MHHGLEQIGSGCGVGKKSSKEWQKEAKRDEEELAVESWENVVRWSLQPYDELSF